MVTLALLLGGSLFCGFFSIDLLTPAPQPRFLILPPPHTHSGGRFIHRCEGPHGDHQRKQPGFQSVCSSTERTAVGHMNSKAGRASHYRTSQLDSESLYWGEEYLGPIDRRAGSTDFHGWDGRSLNPGRRHGHRRPGLLAEVPHLLAMRLTYVTAPFGPSASN